MIFRFIGKVDEQALQLMRNRSIVRRQEILTGNVVIPQARDED